MNAQELLDQLLASGKELAAKGKELADDGADYAAKYIEIPEAGPERDAMMAKVGAGVAATGLLALLLGTEKGRKTLSPVIKVGSLAALGALGYKAYQNWQEENGNPESGVEGLEIGKLDGEAAQERSLAIMRAMVGASKADGHIDDQEHAVITGQMKAAGIETAAASVLLQEMGRPADADRIAKLAQSVNMSVEIYLASLLVTGQQNAAEKAYLAELASKLELAPELVDQIHREAALVT
ncbi:tellurite resistance TerB family protein [Mariniblastus fucicola]|uniref:Inner membrane protein YebE n=1 Tax=Mariniblastus fucicola TaxID=980251 RepID=A0A5B9PBR6_9BACT|nr:tellurite resistance TerB family protein [Mariniblastus fucicola]QEG21936.1 Inner membrane protein YebE [Mariniblastus fucicola]